MTMAPATGSNHVRDRAAFYFQAASRINTVTVDRMMVWLLAIEWAGMIALGLMGGPFTWNGPVRSIHPHFLAAVLSGPAFILPAIALALLRPGEALTRHVVAIAQMLVSVVLIGVTDGRIETHFHIFGSLAFLSFYRDWRVLVTASAVAAMDHIARGFFWPITIYGVATVNPYRWLEHVWWVLFEDFFLILAIRKGKLELQEIANGKSMLYQGAYHDVLTGLANRRLLADKFENSMATDPSVPKAILFVDLDRFKQANDLHGHTVGDKLLIAVANRLIAIIPEDATLARIGGDEFIVFLPSAIDELPHRVATGLLEALSTPFRIEELELLLTATVGIGLCPQHGVTLASLQDFADQAMYSAKAQGRNRVAVYQPSDSSRKERAETIARDLCNALSGNQFMLHFQPIVNEVGSVLSFEALLRWQHPSLGDIPPGEFISVAERSGMIHAIGEWVLGDACRHCLTWQSAGSAPIGVSVNVSALQFEYSDFPAKVRQLLAETGLCSSLLTLELTETALVADIERAQGHLQAIRSLGVKIALDDFGTGFSSLTYLSRLPANSIKLDRTFVQREFGRALGIVPSLIQMAHRIGLTVVAEGVESQAEADWLLELKCDELQGFRFGFPIPASSIAGYLAENERIRAEKQADNFQVSETLASAA